MDSVSLMPVLKGEHPEDRPLRDFMLYQAGFAYEGAIRVGDLVLVVDRDNIATELYDLNTDPAQENNLIEHPDYRNAVVRLREKFLHYNDHDNDTIEPRSTPAFTAAE